MMHRNVNAVIIFKKYQPSDTLNRCPLKIVQSFLRTGDVILKKNILHE